MATLQSTALLLAALAAAGSSSDPELRLSRHLQNASAHAGRTVFPRVNPSHNVTVKFGFVPRLLLSVNSVQQTVHMSGYLFASWEDDRLGWDPAKFGGIDSCVVEAQRVWQPRILVYNGAGDNVNLPMGDLRLFSAGGSRALVYNEWKEEFQFYCKFQMLAFPMDQHLCELQILASDVGIRYKMVVTDKFDKGVSGMSLFSGNSEWQLTDLKNLVKPLNMTVLEYENLQSTMFVAQFRIRRYSNYYDFVLLMPLLLLTALQLLTYLVPLESGEKIGCGVTVLLSFTMFLLLIDNIVPKSETVPAIVHFITASMSASAASLIFNAVLLRMHHTSCDTEMPQWMEKLCVKWIGCITFVRSPSRIVKVAAAGGAAVTDFADKKWQLAAAAMERLAFVIHFLLTVVMLVVDRLANS